MATKIQKIECFSPGVGPHCDPTAITMRVSPEYAKSLLPDGITSVSIKDLEEQQAQKGALAKKKCIADEEARIKQKIHACLCDCVSDTNLQAYSWGNGDGVTLYCFAKCNEEAAADMDWKKCYCMETVCGAPDKSTDPTTPSTGTTDPTTGNPNAPKVNEAKLGPEIASIRGVSSYDEYIPRVYNRAPEGGNVIWVGNPRIVKRVVSTTETDASGDITVTNTTVTQTFIDFILAICAGPVVGMSRLWINDNLIYNNAGSATSAFSALNFSLVKSITDQDKYANTQVDFSLALGEEDQLNFVEGQPAYRGLVYLYVRNFDVTFSSGALPTIKVEVLERVSNSSVANSTPVNITQSAHVSVDTDNRKVFSGHDVFEYDSLTYVETTQRGGEDLVFNALGDCVYVDVDGGLRYYNSITKTYGGGYANVGSGPHVLVQARLHDGSYAPLCVRSTALTTDLYLVEDYGTTISAYASFPNAQYHALVPVELTGETKNRTIVAGIRSSNLGTPELLIDGVLLYDTESFRYVSADTLRFDFNYVIPYTYWGSDATVSYVTSFLDPRDAGLVVFLSTQVLKIDLYTGSVVWSRPTSHMPSGRVSLTAQHVGKLTYATASGELYSLLLETGDILPLNMSVTIAAGGDVFYDALADAITYVSPDMAVHTRYMSRLVSGTIPVATVVEDIMTLTGLTTSDIDLSALESVPCYGYTINTQTTARAAITQLMLVYGFFLYEADGALRFRRAVDADLVHVDRQALKDGLSVDISDAQTSGVDVHYFSTDAYDSEQKQSFTFPWLAKESVTDFSLPILMSDADALTLGERLLAVLANNLRTAKVGLGYSALALEAADYVTVDDSDGVPHSFRVNSFIMGADKTVELELTADSIDYYTAQTAGTATPIGGYTTPDLTSFTMGTLARPLIFMTHAIEDSHYPTYIVDTDSGFYGGIDYRGALPMPATKLYVDGGSTAVATSPLQWGVLSEPLTARPFSSFYTFDEDETVTITFVRDDVTSTMVQDASIYDLDDTTVNMLVVGSELIQFQRYVASGPTITFYGLVRGRRGTEWAQSSHVVGEPCALYTAGGMVLLTQRAVSADQSVTVSVKSSDNRFTYAYGRNRHLMLRPLSPVSASAVKFMTGDIRLTFERRNRFGNVDSTGNTADVGTVANYDILLFRCETSVDGVERIMEYLDLPGVSDHPAIYRWIKAYNLQWYTPTRDGLVAVPYAVTYSKSDQMEDQFDSSADTLYIAIFQNAGGIAPRGKPLLYTLGPA